MGVGDRQHLEDGLDRTVFAADAVQGVEDHIGAGLEGAQQCREVAADIDSPDPIAVVDERLGAFPPARQRHLAFGRPATHQQGDVLLTAVSTPSATGSMPESGRPMRRISHSSTTPVAS